MTNEILIVDDNNDIRLLISGILKDNGFIVREAANFDQAVIEINKKLPDVAVIDVKLDTGDNDGLELLALIKKQDIEYIQKLNTYVQLMKKDLSELDKIYKQLGTELENIKKSGSI